MPEPIAVVAGSYLSYSETFIYSQLLGQRRFKSLVLAYKKGTHGHLFPYSPVVCLPAWENILYQTLGKSPTFSRELRRYKPKLLHAHFGPNGALALPFAKKLGIPLVVTFHGHDVSGLLPENRFTIRYLRYRLTANRMFRYASKILASSTELAQMLVEKIGVPEEKVTVHRLGIGLRQFALQERRHTGTRVLMAGRFVEKKGFEYGIRAFAKLASSRPNLQLTLIGSGPLETSLVNLVNSLQMEGRVEFTGVLSPDKVYEAMCRADIFMAPSVVAANGDRESGVIVIKEAAATGLPVVGTWHGGIPEIVESGKTGYLVSERDVDALSGALEKLVDNRQERLDFGMNGRRKMENEYDVKKQNHQLENYFSEVIRSFRS